MSLKNIPKIIHQTWKRKNDLPDPILKSINKWKDLNKEYKYKFYDDDDCRNFIKEHFGNEVSICFDILIPGAFKADLFRYCVLYIKGGVYADIDTEPLISLSDILQNYNYDFVSVKEKNNIPGIYQAFIACKPKILFLKKVIEQIVTNVKNKYYPNLKKYKDPWIGVLSITGPVLLANKVNEYIKNENNIKIKLMNFSDNNKYIIDFKGTNFINIRIDGYDKIFESYFKKVKLKKIYLKNINI
jgi:mannosyltransferase OCH1-like enzyme